MTALVRLQRSLQRDARRVDQAPTRSPPGRRAASGRDLGGEADRDRSHVVAEAALVDEDVVRRLEHLDRARAGAPGSRRRSASRSRYRCRIERGSSRSAADVPAVGLRRERQPGVVARPAVAGLGRPRDRGSAAVAPAAARIDLALRRHDRRPRGRAPRRRRGTACPAASGAGRRPLGRCARRRRSGCGGAGCRGSTAPTSPSAPASSSTSDAVRMLRAQLAARHRLNSGAKLNDRCSSSSSP